MNASQIGVSAALSAYDTLYNNGTLVLYSGTMPASPETALSGNTALVTATYSATAFSAPTYSSPDMVATASFTAASYAPTSSGTATFARAYESNGTTALADYTVGTSGTDIIVGSTTIATGTNVTFSQTMKMPAV